MSSFVTAGGDIGNGELLAQNAQKTANDAKDLAGTADNNIKNINDPNYLSPFEKPQLQVQMDNFATIYAADKDIATAEGVDFAAYDAAYQAYLAYMTPLVADMTTYSPIARSTFNSMVTAVQAEQKRFNAATQAQYNQQMSQAKADIADGQTKYKALLSEARVMESSAAGVADKANQLASKYDDTNSLANQALDKASSAQNDASAAVSKAESAASEFGKVDQKADSAFANAMSAESAVSSAVSQASSAAADSKDAKQIAGAVNQSYKTLTDGSTMTIAELQNGLAVKLTKTDLNGYATQDWSRNQIKITADGINGTISSVKNTVDSQTTSINDLKADSNGFRDQFTTVTNTIGQHTTDIGTLQRDSKSLSSSFDSLDSDNKTNQHNIGELQQSAKEFNSTLVTVQTQVQNSAVGTNLLTGTSNAQDYTLSGSDWAVGSLSSNGTNASIPCTPGASYTYSVIVKSMTYDCYPEIQFFDSGKNLIFNSTNVPGKDIGMRKTTSVAPENAAFVGAHMVLNKPSDSQTVVFNSEKLEKGSLSTDWCANPADNATVTAVSKISQTVDSVQVLATNNHGDIAKLQVTAQGLQSTVSDKVSSDQLTQLSDQLTNKISDLSSSTSSQFTETAGDINAMVKKGDVVNQFNLDAGGALLSTSGNSTKIVFSSPNIIFDSANPVQIPNANIPGTLTGKTFEAGTITATTKIKGSDIEAPIIHSPSGSFKLDGNTGDIIGASIHSADNSWGIDKNGNINGATINAPTLTLGLNGTFTESYDYTQPASLFLPKKNKGTLTFNHGVLQSRGNMQTYASGQWGGMNDNLVFQSGMNNAQWTEVAPGYIKLDLFKQNGYDVAQRTYTDPTGFYYTARSGDNSYLGNVLQTPQVQTAGVLTKYIGPSRGQLLLQIGQNGKDYGLRVGSYAGSEAVLSDFIYNATSSNSSNVHITENGHLVRTTSASKYKYNIKNPDIETTLGDRLLNVHLATWNDKSAVDSYAEQLNTGEEREKSSIDKYYGLIAEQLRDAGLDMFISYGKNHEIEGIQYDRAWVPLLSVIRRLNNKVNDYELRLSKLEGKTNG